jgi:hypothetical protein
MDEQELINIWNEQDNSLEKSINVNQHLLKDVTLNKIKSMLNIFRRTNIFELIVNFIFLFWLVNFIKNHLESMVFLIASAILYLLMLASIVYNIYNLYLVKSITYNTYIVETQQKIERMKLYKKYSVNALYIIIPITSVPFILVLAKGFLHIDLYQILGATYLWLFTLGSLAITLLVVWFIKQFPDEEMEKANSFLSTIQEFQA